ncbi:hypothetical protein QJQ45_019861 [Haematococcus lacustris]|nr:hypothetical protein QJQ45_019861 [Haematococcus lacustris]
MRHGMVSPSSHLHHGEHGVVALGQVQPGGARQWEVGPQHGARSLDECYFQPISSCTYQSVQKLLVDAPEYHIQQHEQHRANGSTAVLVRLPSDNKKIPSPQDEKLGIPDVFKPMLEQSPIPRVWWYYWWRCQSSAFMVRPTSLTLAKLQLAREHRFSPADREALATQSWVSVYVRRGDKAKETPGMVTDPAVFMSAATRLMQAKEAGSPLQRIFLATEDVDVHAYFVTQATVPVMVANVSRYKANVSYSPLEHAARIGPHVEFIDSLLSLELTMGGDAFVYSMVSNWGRLVNELRSTVSCKAGRPFFDPDQPAGVKTLFWK